MQGYSFTYGCDFMKNFSKQNFDYVFERDRGHYTTLGFTRLLMMNVRCERRFVRF